MTATPEKVAVFLAVFPGGRSEGLLSAVSEGRHKDVLRQAPLTRYEGEIVISRHRCLETSTVGEQVILFTYTRQSYGLASILTLLLCRSGCDC